MIHVQYHVEFYNTVQYHTIQFCFIEKSKILLYVISLYHILQNESSFITYHNFMLFHMVFYSNISWIFFRKKRNIKYITLYETSCLSLHFVFHDDIDHKLWFLYNMISVVAHLLMLWLTELFSFIVWCIIKYKPRGHKP